MVEERKDQGAGEELAWWEECVDPKNWQGVRKVGTGVSQILAIKSDASGTIGYGYHTVLGQRLAIPRDIDPTSRLFKKALWLPGWNHLISNVMKASLNTLNTWPSLLQKLRTFT